MQSLSSHVTLQPSWPRWPPHSLLVHWTYPTFASLWPEALSSSPRSEFRLIPQFPNYSTHDPGKPSLTYFWKSNAQTLYSGHIILPFIALLTLEDFYVI